MHAFLYNEAIFELSLRPRTPLLIKAGRSGEEALDPTLPDMSFVRMRRPGQTEEQVFIPGSSLRGVIRSHAEKLVRSVNAKSACDPTQTGGGSRKACFAGESNTDVEGPEAYTQSCYTCRLFGNTALAGRLRIADFYPNAEQEPLLSRRYGVAIDRVTGAVAQGPFEIEILTDAHFAGQLTVRNFTLGQLGMIAAALLDLHDGIVPMGYGKSRGLGRVSLTFDRFAVRTLRDPKGAIQGVGALASEADRTAYRLPSADQEHLPVSWSQGRERGFYSLSAVGDPVVALLESLAGRWPQEL
jgi:CRISPR-associated protein Csm3